MSARRDPPARRSTWQRVSARPSEYLIKLRRGRVVRHGHGLSVLLWPGETCAIIPTSIQRTAFVADQITAEKVGVAVTGIAVYRIADPLLAFRVLDITDGGGECLASILKEMFIGAVRRLVANMTVEDCLTRRKESIAQELMEEIRPVVSGQGRPDDSTDRGWGVVIDTIEIQDVRIQSESVFADLQAPYRSRLKLEARTAQLERDQQAHAAEVAAQTAALEADQDLSRRRAQAEERSELQSLERRERVELAELEQSERLARARLATEIEARQRDQRLVEAHHELATHTAGLEASRQQAALDSEWELARRRATLRAAVRQVDVEGRLQAERLEQAARLEVGRQRLALQRERAELDAWVASQQREQENRVSDARIRHALVTTGLPAVAEAVAGAVGQVHLTRVHTGGDGEGGLGPVASTLLQVLAVARASGFDLSRWGLAPGGASPDSRGQSRD